MALPFVLKYRSPQGAELNLANNPRFLLSSVDGLTAANVDISATEFAAHDGDFINNLHTTPRGIVLYLTMYQGENVENVKREVLGVIKPKQTGVLYWDYEGRQLEISGTVEAIEMQRFEKSVVMQITLYCSGPYWESAAYIIQKIELIMKLHHFEVAFPQNEGIVMGFYNLDLTRSFVNDGDAETGAVITIIATGDITNPLLERADGLYFGVNETMQAGDSIEICTIKGKKTVTKNGVNILQKVKEGSTWLQLEVGENVFTISEAGGTANMYFTFKYKQKYV